ncbi:MAG: dienelactone hydrolase family protein [Myxococcota bacterium]
MREQDVKLGYLVQPEQGSHPGVVLVHDVWGLSEHARDLTRRLSAEDFAVLGIDLYRERAEVKIENPGEWMRNLSDPQVLADIEAGVALLASDPITADHKIGVVGFCMGGMYALMAGCGAAGESVGAVAPFYGLLSHEHGILHDEAGLDPALKPRQPLDAARDLRCPLLAFFGDQDEFVPVADIRELEKRLGEIDQPSEVVVYPEVGHAFVNDTRPDAYREKEARDAWARLVAFFRQHLL